MNGMVGQPGESVTKLRLATSADAEAILAIYEPIVRETAISFELDPPTVAEMKRRIESTLTTLPWLVCEAEAGIVGYAYASRHRERAAYQWSVDVSVYVAQENRGGGVARRLYTALLGMLDDLGYYNAFAGIALPNPASVGFHQSMGFRPIGIYHKVGYKLGVWHDVGWWQRVLHVHGQMPGTPRPMREYVGSGAFNKRLRASG